MIRAIQPAEYHRLGRGPNLAEWFLSKSMLFDFASSPFAWKLRHDRGAKKEPTPAMEWGSAADALATEENGLARIGFVDAASWQGKAAQAERLAIRTDGRIPMLEGQREDLLRAATMLSAHMERHGLTLAEKQVAATMTGDIDGQPLHFKCLFDFLLPGEVADLKTTNDLDRVRSVAWKFRYHWQGALYIDAARANGRDVPDVFRLHFQESCEPFRTRILVLEPEDIALGRKEYIAAAKLWLDCLTTNVWPGEEMETIRGMKRENNYE